MSNRTITATVVIALLVVVIAYFVIASVQLNNAMPGIAKTAEAKTNATFFASLTAKP